jgi:tetratricopeptide (TPR) repeat protein
MRNLAISLLAAAIVAGCATSGSVQPESEPVIVRPVVVAEHGGEWLLGAIALIKEGNFRQAEANLEEIVKVRPDIPEAHFNLGWVKQQLRKHAEAITHLRAGLQLRPGDVRAANLIAISQRELGLFSEAEATYIEALTVAPDYDKALLNLGILYELYLRKPQLALERYRRYQALRQTPDTRVAGWIAVLERQEAK